MRAGEPLREWWIRQGPERRLMGWRRGEAEQAWWLGSERMAYWELQEEGDEHLRSRLGLDGVPLPRIPLPPIKEIR